MDSLSCLIFQWVQLCIHFVPISFQTSARVILFGTMDNLLPVCSKRNAIAGHTGASYTQLDISNPVQDISQSVEQDVPSAVLLHS